MTHELRHFITLVEHYQRVLESAVVIRPAGWRAANDVPHSWTRPDHLYRGMSEAEYKATVGAGLGVKSDERYCATGEGTCFDADASSAESYANFGRGDPRVSGRANYLVEIEADHNVTQDKDGYWKAPGVPQERVRRVWRMSADDDTIVAQEVPVPSHNPHLVEAKEFIRYDPAQAYKANDRDELKKAVGFYSEQEFIDLITGRKQAPRTHYIGYNEDGEAISSFSDPERGSRYARVERRDPSRQAVAAYRKYQTSRETLARLYAELSHERGQDTMDQHTFTPDEIEVKSFGHGRYDAFVRGRMVARGFVHSSAEPDRPKDTRSMYNVSTFDVADRQKGIARKLYQKIEQDLARDGLRLVPSKVQYPDAVEFWKRYRTA